MTTLSDRMAIILERLAEMFPDIYSPKIPTEEGGSSDSNNFEYRGVIQ